MMRTWKIVRSLFKPDEIEVNGERLPTDEHAEFFAQLRRDREAAKACEVVAAIDRLYEPTSKRFTLEHVVSQINNFRTINGCYPSTFVISFDQRTELYDDVNFQRMLVISTSQSRTPNYVGTFMGVDIIAAMNPRVLGPQL